MNTTNLGLPYVAPGQAQKHVTVNDSLRRLDALVQLVVESASTISEPGAPADGAVWIVPPGKSGASWAAFADWSLGYYRDGAWEQLTPREGWLASVKETGALLRFTGTGWALSGIGKLAGVSATDRLLGRSSAGAGPAEEITCTAAGRALLDDADAAAQRATLGLGSAALVADAGLVHLAGAETITGAKTFAASLTVANLFGASPATAYTIGAEPVSSFASGGYMQLYGSASGPGALVIISAGAASFAVSPTGLSFNSNAVFHGGASPLPAADNTINLGSGSLRFATLYAATGAINTSDAREKTPLRSPSGAELRAIRRILAGIGVYQRLDAVAAKGQAARLHIGVTAQDVADAFMAEDLDPGRYALWCADDEAEGRQGLRHDQLFALALAVLAGEP